MATRIKKISTRRWSKELTQDIMDMVLQRLCIFDYLRCREVCHSWLEAVNTAIASKHCHPAQSPSWLLCDKNKFYSPSDRKMYNLYKVAHTNSEPCVGSTEGWLVMADLTQSIIYMINPVSGDRVMLPRRSRKGRGYLFSFSFRKVIASSAPTSLKYTCIVALLNAPGGTLSFCRLGDKSWTLIDHKGLPFEDIQFIDGRLYAATKNPLEFLFVFDINDTHYRAERLVMLQPGPDLARFKLLFGVEIQGNIILANDSTSNDLFMIIFADNYPDHMLLPYTEAFQVFKLEFNANGSPPRWGWAEIVNFDDRILFLRERYKEFFNLRCSTHTNCDLQTTKMHILCGLNFLRLDSRLISFTPDPW